MDKFLQANNANLPGSPTHSFIADEVASICPLITPSPPTNDLINPLPEPGGPSYGIGEELATILQQHVQDSDKAGDSASSSSSALAEPTCTQLLNHRNTNYHHITKTEDAATEETAGKVQPFQLTFRNPPDNYFFMSWNWPLIRRILLWIYLSALFAMVAVVVAMIWSLPKTCNPETEWYQGKVLYEVFPASFYDSDKDMYGDFKGMSLKAEHFTSLGIGAVRLNSIFKTPHYPEDYKNVTTLTEIAPQLGDFNDLIILIKHLHSKNISLLLDLPVAPVLKQLGPKKAPNESLDHPDAVEEALLFWTSNGVDGFYLKELEELALDPELGHSLRRWKKIVGPSRPLIVNHSLMEAVPRDVINVVFSNVDLVDFRLEIEKGVVWVSKQLELIQNGSLFARPGLPWIHWSLSDENSRRLANILPYSNATLGATLLQLMLPGTPSLFYGNEIGLQQISDPDLERHDLQHLHQLAPMVWQNRRFEVHQWLHGEATSTNFNQSAAVAEMIRLRAKSPAIYINSVYKEGENKANAEVKYSSKDLLVIQRWYPRRKSYVVVSNLGNATKTADLSRLLYSGEIKIGPRAESKSESVSFKDVTLTPGESVVIELD